MIKDHTVAENFYLSSTMRYPAKDLVALTIADFIIKKQIVLDHSTMLVTLNCELQKWTGYERIILDHLGPSPLPLGRFVNLCNASLLKSDFIGRFICPLLKQKGFIKWRVFLTKEGKEEKALQDEEIRTISEKVLNRKQIPAIMEKIGAHVFLLQQDARSVLKDLYPDLMNLRQIIFKHTGMRYRDSWVSSNDGASVMYDSGSSSDTSSDSSSDSTDFGGGDFGGGGADSDF